MLIIDAVQKSPFCEVEHSPGRVVTFGGLWPRVWCESEHKRDMRAIRPSDQWAIFWNRTSAGIAQLGNAIDWESQTLRTSVGYISKTRGVLRKWDLVAITHCGTTHPLKALSQLSNRESCGLPLVGSSMILPNMSTGQSAHFDTVEAWSHASTAVRDCTILKFLGFKSHIWR